MAAEMAEYTLEATAAATMHLVSRPTLTISCFLPVAYLAGRFNWLSLPVAGIAWCGLMGLLAVSYKRKATKVPAPAAGAKLEDPTVKAEDDESEDRDDWEKRKLESVEWLNGIVRNIWLRYPDMVGELLRGVVLEEILAGLRRDKVLPAGPIKDIQCSNITLRKRAPWITGGHLNDMRSRNELCLTLGVRFVSDDDAGATLNVLAMGGVNIPIKVENISVETELIVRAHLIDKAPFCRVVWISMTKEPTLDLAIRPLSGVDVMAIPGLDQILHDLIMTGIRNEIVLPMGKIVPIPPGMPDEYYLEHGKVETERDDHVGRLVLIIEETKIMTHPMYKEGGTDDLFVRVTLGQQQFRTHKIVNTVREKMMERFDFLIEGAPQETVILDLMVLQEEVAYEPVPLGSISVAEVRDEGKFSKAVWVETPAIVNGRMKIRCMYTEFRHPLKTISRQYNPQQEFIGGCSDWTKEGANDDVVRHVKLGVPGQASRALPPGAGGVGAASDHHKKGLWDSLLPRRQYRGICWVTVHEGKELQGKIIGTRDPYVKLTINDQSEKTTAKVNSTNPKYEETFAMFVRDTVNDVLELSVLQNDVAMGRHFVDDSIGKYTFNMKQLIDASNGGDWSGWITLKEARSGKMHLSLKFEQLENALIAGNNRHEQFEHGISPGVPVSRKLLNAKAILQVMMLKAEGIAYGEEKKDAVPHPYVVMNVGEQKAETRVVRAQINPEFNEYLEFIIRDVATERLDLRVESKDGFLVKKMGSLKLPINYVPKGQVLQEWYRLRDTPNKARVLLEIRISFIEWEGQWPKATEEMMTKFGVGLPKEEQAAGDDELDSEWAMLDPHTSEHSGSPKEQEEQSMAKKEV